MNLPFSIAFSSIMMLMITGMVYSTIGDSKEACKDNTDNDKLVFCIKTMDEIKQVVQYGWFAYIGGIALLVISSYRNKELQKKATVEEDKK